MLTSGKFFINGVTVCGIQSAMRNNRDIQLEWLEKALAKTGLKVPELAQRAKLDPSTIYKFQRGDIDEMRERTMRRLAHIADIPLPDIPGLSEGDAVDFDISDMPDVSGLSEQSRLFALKVKTSAVEKAGVEPGDILVFDRDAVPQTGDIVCAQIVDYRLGTADTIIRCFDKPYLIALSDSPEHRRPLIVDDDRVQIRGVLVKQVRVKLFRNVA